MSREKFQIGWLVLKEDTEFTNHFETASWHENVMVKAGKYPITVSKVGLLAGDEDIYAHLPGEVTSDYFPTLFAGSNVGGPYDSKRNAGTPASHSVRWRNYELAYSVLAPEQEKRSSFNVELLPCVKAVYTTFEGLDGQLVNMAHVVFNEKELQRMVEDSDPEVRRAIAKLGYGWDKLVRDSDTWVRVEVARQGYGLDLLAKDSIWFVHREVEVYLREHKVSLKDWINENPDKCAVSENKVQNLENVIKSCKAKADIQKKPERVPGKDINNHNLR